MIYNQLIRDKAAGQLKQQGYEIKGKILKGEKYKKELYSLFFDDFKECINETDKNRLKVLYAEMLEALRALMINAKIKINQISNKLSQPLQWYNDFLPNKKRLADARIDLLQKFDEVMQSKTEAVKDQLGDAFTSFKGVVEAQGLSFAKVEEIRRENYERHGGFNKGVYLEEVISKTVELKQ